MRPIAKLPTSSSISIADDLREPIRKLVRRTVLEDFRTRHAAFAKGKRTGPVDELFIGLDRRSARDLARAEERARPMLAARIAWLTERRLELALVGMADGEDAWEGDSGNDKPLPALRKGAPRRIRHVRRRAVPRPSQG